MRIIQIMLLWTLWSACVFLTPASTYWRDSGEFIIQAFALDISHPAGFPLYGMLGNLFALLPLGPIPWRVILLSGMSLILLIYLVSQLLRLLLSRSSTPSSLQITLATALVAVSLVFILPLALKQTFSAEVYILNAALLLLITTLTLRGTQQQNFHCLGSAAFIGGLTVGNHVSSALVGASFAAILLLSSSFARRAVIKLLLLSLTGMLIYTYLPVRAAGQPPLNTGNPDSAPRFWNVVSDARDRQLRAAPEEDSSTLDIGGISNLFSSPAKSISRDLEKMRLPRTPLMLTALFAAAAGLLLVEPLAATLLAAVMFSNYVFFAGWDGDPWVPAVCALAVLLVCSMCKLFTLLPDHGVRTIPLVCAVLLAALIAKFPLRTTFAELLYLRDYETPAHATEAWLTSSSAPIVITENSWFLARYLSDIEGVADEKKIFYQPSILFPAHFAPARLLLKDGTMLDSEADRLARNILPADASFGTLGLFIDNISRQSSIMVEPGLLINTALSSILQLNQQGTAEINRGAMQQSSSLSAVTLAERFTPLVEESLTSPPSVGGDVRNYFENILNNLIDLLKKQQQEATAAKLLKTLCLPFDSSRCSLVSLNHLGLLLMKLGENAEAAELYRHLLSDSGDEREALEKNLALAIKGLEQKNSEQNLSEQKKP